MILYYWVALVMVFTLAASEAGSEGTPQDDRKIAFLFMSRGPMPLEDIWREFFRWKADEKHYNIHIHVHKGYKIPSSSFFHGKEIPVMEGGGHNEIGGGVLWGNMGQVLAIKRLVRHALKDPLAHWFTMMSEACIPLTNFRTMRNSLLAFDKSIVNACDMGAGEMETHSRWRPGLDEVGFQKKWWRKSGTWFALLRDHAVMFVEEKKFEHGWDKVPCCDEHYLTSILAYHGQDNRTTCTDGFCHVHWPSLVAMHPHTYGGDEITPELFQHLAQPEGSSKGFAKQCSGVEGHCHFTARKFSAAAKYQLLENIDMILSDEEDEYDGNPWDHHQDKFRLDTSEGEGVYYLIENGYLRRIPDAPTLMSLHHNNASGVPTQPLTGLDKKAYPMGEPLPSRADGQVVKAPKNNWVFALQGGKRRGIPNMDTLLHLGFKLSDVKVLPAADIEQIVMGEPMPDVNSRGRGKAPPGGEEGGQGRHHRKKKGHELGEHDHLHTKKKMKDRGAESSYIDTTNTSADLSARVGGEGQTVNTSATPASVAASTALSWLYQSEATTNYGKKQGDPFWLVSDYFADILDKFKDSWKWGRTKENG